MSHRHHLTSLQPAIALRQSLGSHYGRTALFHDAIAGVTVGIIAIPLAMALAIASGVAPQYGLYTAIIAGIVIALSGGSRLSVSGPTAAFVVLLAPISAKYGLGGLLIATAMSGCFLMLLALMRLGRLIQYIPEPVTLGFTGGIAIVIALLQVKDLFALPIDAMPAEFWEKLTTLAAALPQWQWPGLSIGLVTLAVLIFWPKLRLPLPPHLPAILIGTLLALFFTHQGYSVDTIGSRFSYLLADGSTAQGIPPFLPSFAMPWSLGGADGTPLTLSWQLVQDLLPPAIAIAMLGAIESLLCAVVLDGMTGKRHSANSELFGQGLGNLIGPFFGAIPATAALARSAANVRAGAVSPLAAVFHALTVLLALVLLAPVLAYIPMAAMAALLLMVAWHMSEAAKSLQLIRTAPLPDVLVLVLCLLLTVVFDMVIAIGVGIVLAALLLMGQLAASTRLVTIDTAAEPQAEDTAIPPTTRTFRIDGPLFFAAADNVFSELQYKAADASVIILDWQNVTLLDAGGLSALERLLRWAHQEKREIRIASVPFQPLRFLVKAGMRDKPGLVSFYPDIQAAQQGDKPAHCHHPAQ
ncbi:C4-dicarboxylic acid transporter DauA [Shewanella sp. JM162201]|uniref:C4-dicarboxylic acid transporter DauA n=1 Tax=Shewanella jiangmenensis TaxID=2837387 RepID=A0ABS5UYW8_9GAMM|nr:C4-dicarboxylic acid transporter DauA [Shewanella jiangmenensis]MBT1443349.1 C4-dicarboxylic acid transporter DauA [Shewanella jiangmenensis]